MTGFYIGVGVTVVVVFVAYHFHIIGKISALENSIKERVKAEVALVKSKL